MFGLSNKELAKRYIESFHTNNDVYFNHMNHMRDLDRLAKQEPTLREYIKEIDNSLVENLSPR